MSEWVSFRFRGVLDLAHLSILTEGDRARFACGGRAPLHFLVPAGGDAKCQKCLDWVIDQHVPKETEGG